MASFLYKLFEKYLSVPENASTDIGRPDNILIIRQHSQFGDLLAGVSLFRAIKEKYPECKITLIASPENFTAIEKNKYIDSLFCFDKKRLFNPYYFIRTIRLLRKQYHIVIVPVVVSISFTSNIIARLSKSKIRIGPASVEGEPNKSAFFFDRRVELDWRQHPDSNVADRVLDIVRPFGINTNKYKAEITFDNTALRAANKYLKDIAHKKKDLLIGLSVGVNKPPNRWPLDKYIALITKINNEYPVRFFLAGSSADSEELDYVKKGLPFEIDTFLNHSVAENAALISKASLFITNDNNTMHIAGATDTPQISIFGPTNPFNWAPVGANKIFIRKSELIDEVTVDDVFSVCKNILPKRKPAQE